MGLNLEIKYDTKTQGIPDAKTTTFIIDAILHGLHHAPSPPKGLIISSYVLPFLEEIRKRDAQVNLGYIVLGYDEKYIEEVQSVGGVSIHINKETFLDVDENDARKRIACFANS